MVTSGTCELCSKTASSKCAGCGIAYYCSREHQKAHWSKHKHICKPFTVKEDGVLGRHLVATRRIRRGEVVLKERPLLVGPAQGTPPVCLGCLNGMTRGSGQPLACERCGWPMCSRQCAESPQHRPECQWTVAKRKSKVKISQLNVSPHPTYACVLPLRYCYQKSNNPKLFEKLEGLESHRKERKDTDKYNWDKFGVVQLLRRFYSLPESEFTDEQLLDICGVIQVNGHEVPLSEPGHVGIYWKCSMLEHSCWANCSKSFTEAGEVLVRAAADIAEGEHLSICYTDPLWSTPQRRYHLKETKFFECNCPRCSDPTEMGTYFSVFRCTQSGCQGMVMPTSFIEMDEAEDWTCNACSSKVPRDKVTDTLRTLADAAARLDRDSIDSCSKFLDSHTAEGGAVHQNLYQVVEVALGLAQLYGQSSPLESLTDQQIRHKIQLCKSLIALTDIIVPAECRIRGVLMFELHAAIAESARRDSAAGTIDASQLYNSLLESKVYLEKAGDLLKFEPETMPEGKMGKQSAENLRDLEKLLANMRASSMTIK